jgi:predicted small lipoprotein YifL
MMRKLSAAVLVLILLAASLAACGSTPSPTAVPPTKTPAPTATPLPGLALAAEAFRSAEGGFAVGYPEGWQNLSFGSMVVFARNEQAMQSSTPTDTLVMVEGGPLANLTMAQTDMSGATDSRKMLELALAALSSGDTTFETGEIKDVQVGGTQGAAADISGEDSDMQVAGRVVCFYLGENGVDVLAAGPADHWNEFIPTFEAMVASMTFFAPEVPTGTPEPTTGPTPISGPAPTLVGGPPEGFVWRVGGASGFEENQYGSFRGMDIGPGGDLFVADTWKGIYVFTPDGRQVASFGASETGMTDIKAAPNGNLYVASWNANGVYVFTPQGEQVGVGLFGQAGKGDGEFGDFSPEFLAICPDGRVYVADENKDDQDNTYERVQVFDADGKYLAQWSVSQVDSSFDISGMDCDAAGKVYLTGYYGDYVMVFSGEGEHLADLGKDALYFTGAYGISVGPGGDLYVGTWDGRVIVLDPEGNKLGEWGVKFEGEGNLAEGQVYDVYGIVADDYGNVYFSDFTGDYTYLTKFKFGKG